MIAPEYFNNHIAVEGEIIVKRVPNDTGSVMVWNSTTKKLSVRTHAEIVSDLNLMTVSTNQLVTGIKSFVTSGGNYAPFNNTLQIYADDGSLPSMTYSKGGAHVGQIMFDSDGFYFKNGDNNAFYNVKAEGFEKSNSDNNHVLLGGGGHQPVSDFVKPKILGTIQYNSYAFLPFAKTQNNTPFEEDKSVVLGKMYLTRDAGSLSLEGVGVGNSFEAFEINFKNGLWNGDQNLNQYHCSIIYKMGNKPINSPKLVKARYNGVEYIGLKFIPDIDKNIFFKGYASKENIMKPINYLSNDTGTINAEIESSITEIPFEPQNDSIYFNGKKLALDESLSNFVGSKITNGSYNANDLTTNSITYGYSVANAPSTVGAHSFSILNLDTANPDYKMQLGFDGDTNEMFSRIKSNGNWTDWSKYVASSQLANLVTTDTGQDLTAQKWFKNTAGTSNWDDHKLILAGFNGSKAGLSFVSSGMDAGSLDFDGYYHFKFSSGAYTNIKSGGFIKDGSSANHFLTGDGGHYDSRKKEDDWFHSGRNFPQGTLIQTDVDYSQTYGDQFLLEMKGNMYGGGNPLIAKIQGYIYYDTIIAKSGYSTLYYWNYIIALNLNGKLCFWFPSLSYWQGFDVKVTIGYGGLDQGKNRVVSVSDSTDPGGSKRVEIALEHLLTKEQLISGNTFWEKKNIGGYWALDSDKPIAGLNGNEAQVILSGGLLASHSYADSQFIPAYGIHSRGFVQSDEGFQNRYWKADQRNRIWSFANSDAYGLSYYQGSGLSNDMGEGIGFHFGDASDYKAYIHRSGNVYTKGTVTVISPDSVGSQNIGTIGTDYKLILGNGNDVWKTRPNYGTAFWVEDSGQGYIQQQRFDGQKNTYKLNLQPYGDDVTINGHVAWHGGNFNPNNYIPTSHPAYGLASAEISNWRHFGGYWDNRNIQPVHLGTQKLQIGFTNWFNNGDQASHYADYLHFGGYQDSSGGNQNLIMFSKNGFGLRQWQGSPQGVSAYQSYVDYWNTGHFSNVDVSNWKDLVTGGTKALRHINPQNFNLISYVSSDTNTATIGFIPYNYQQKIADNGAVNNHPDMYQGMIITGNDPIDVHNFGLYVDADSQLFIGGGLYGSFLWRKAWTEQHFSQGDINAWQFNRFNTKPMSLLDSTNNADNLTASGFYQIGYGTQNSGADLGINDNVRALLHFETENIYSASQIQTQRYAGNIISRTKADGVWSEWVRHWGNNDFTKSDINSWNSKADSNHTHIFLSNEENNSAADAHTLLEDYKFKFVHRINAGPAGSLNMFPTPNNANSILAVSTHPGGYGTLLGINGDSEIFTKLVSAGSYSPTWRQIAYRDWVLQQIPSLNDYVTVNTEQNIVGKKTFAGSTGNGYTGASVMINGNGSVNTVYPTLAFHQPGLYAGTLSYRGNGFYFMNIDGNGFDFVRAAGYIKDGSNDQMLLLGGGSHEDKNKYVFGSNSTGTIQAYSPEAGLPVNSFKPVKSGFYRPNGENEYGSLLMWVAHPQDANNYGAGIAFDYGGTNAYLTGIDASGTKIPNKKLWHSGDFNQGYVTEWKNAANAGILTSGSAVQIDGTGGIDNGSNSRPNKVWFDYNWAGSGRAGSLINFSGLNSAYNVELFAAYHGDANAIGIRTRNGDNGTWSLPRWLWNSENFRPSDYYNNDKGSIANQDNLVANGSQWISTSDTGSNFDGALANKIVEGTFANFNAYDKSSKNLGFTLMARTSTEQGIYYKTWYGGGSQTWRRLLEAGDNNVRSLGFSGGNIDDYPYLYTLDGQFRYLLSQESLPNANNWGAGNNTWLMSGRKTTGEIAWRNYGNGHTIFDISNGHTPWGANKSNKDAEIAWSESYPILVGGNGYQTYGVRVDSARNADNLGNIAAGSYVTQSNLNSQLNGYASLNGIQTFTNTNTFAQSPVIPAGTLGTHAVNVNQLSTKANGLENAKAIGFSSGNMPTADGNDYPYIYHSSGGFVALATQSYTQTGFLSTPNGTSVTISGANLNNYLKTGFYRGSGLTNAPLNNSGWWYVAVETHDGTWIKQTATSFGSGNTPNITYQRTVSGGNWSAWVQIWTQADFTQTNIQQWNYAYQYGLKVNEEFTTNLNTGLVLADDYFGGDSGIIDNQQERLVAAKFNEYYHYGSQYGNFEGLAFNWKTRRFGMGREANDSDKLTVEGSVKASKNFKSEDERPDTLFIPNGNTATLRDEIINDESDYAIRLDPHEYEVDSSGFLDINDRNRLIHIIGEQIKMVVNFKEIYPKQQIVIYNFDPKGNMEVKIYGKTIYYIEPGCFLRLYVTKSLRIIAERQQPCEFIW